MNFISINMTARSAGNYPQFYETVSNLKESKTCANGTIERQMRRERSL